MALSVIASNPNEQTSTGISFDTLLGAPTNRRFSTASSVSSVSTSSWAPAQQAQDLRLSHPQQQQQNNQKPTTTASINNRRRKAPEDYVDEHDDLEVRDGRLMCKYCSMVIGGAIARNPSGSSITNKDDDPNIGLSRSSRIREHLQSKRHIVQKQLQLMNAGIAATSSLLSPELLSKTFQLPPGFESLLLEGAAALGGTGAVNQLTLALKSAANVIDAEINDIDERIGQLQTQIDQLRAKKAKLAGHKSEINRSLVGVAASAGQTTAVINSDSSPVKANANNRRSTPLSTAPRSTTAGATPCSMSSSPGSIANPLAGVNHTLAAAAALAMPSFSPNFAQLHNASDLLQELTASFGSQQLNANAFSAILASAAESASALMNFAASQQQQQQQQAAAKPLHSLLSSVIDASQAEDLSSDVQESENAAAATNNVSSSCSNKNNNNNNNNLTINDDGLLCLSLAAAAATPQPTLSSLSFSSSSGVSGLLDSSSSSKSSSGVSSSAEVAVCDDNKDRSSVGGANGGSRRKNLKPTRLLSRHSSSNGGQQDSSIITVGPEPGAHDGSTTPADLTSSYPISGADNDANRLAATGSPFDDDCPLSLVKCEQREQYALLQNDSAAHSPSVSGDDMASKLLIMSENEVDRPTTPEIQQYNPALADKRFRGKAVQYCLLRRFNDHEVYSNWIRLQKVTRDKRTDTETGVKDFFRCPYARKIGWQPCPFRMYALFRPDAPGQITVFRSEVDHYHAQLPGDAVSSSGNNNTAISNSNMNASSEDGMMLDGAVAETPNNSRGVMMNSHSNIINNSDAIESCSD